MKHIFQKIILMVMFLSLFTLPTSALSFGNFSFGGTGAINNGNGYFNDDALQFNYTGSRNVYVVTEDTGIFLVEPVSRANAISSTIQIVNSTTGLLADAVVYKGYVYFIDGTTLQKKSTRNDYSVCESTDNTSGTRCAIPIDSAAGGRSLRVYNGVLYYTSGQVLKHLDDTDNSVTDFTMSVVTPSGTDAQVKSFAVTTNGSLQVYLSQHNSGNPTNTYRCKSTGCVLIQQVTSTFAIIYATYYTTSTQVYSLTNPSPETTLETLYYISNSTAKSVDYVSNNALTQNNRVFVGDKSTIGLMAASATTYTTFNSNEEGVSNAAASEGSGIVSYISKSVDVPNSNYYNDSIIPINVDLKFIISNENHTNYATSIFWHLHARDPTGIEVEDHDLPVVCTQAQPWWDPLGVFTLFIIDNVEPWACDGTQTVQYIRTPGQFWLNGTYEADLTEQIPGTISVLSTDSWNIVNNSSTSTGTINPPIGGSPDSSNPMKGVTDNFLSSGMMVVFILLIVFAAAGNVIGGLAGAVIGFGGGFLFCAAFGLIPMWALFLFAILIITAFAVMMGKAVTGGGPD